jgi:hypothetical protein
LASSLTFLAGGLVAYPVSARLDVGFLVPFVAENFIYIGVSDLVPKVNKHIKICGTSQGAALIHRSPYIDRRLSLAVYRSPPQPARTRSGSGRLPVRHAAFPCTAIRREGHPVTPERLVYGRLRPALSANGGEESLE